jgi:mono/diheme cytochrome c family protein
MKPGSRQEGRENPDPQELSRPIPLAVLGFALLMVLWGVWYILSSHSFVAPEYGDARSLDDLRAKTAATGAAGTADGAAIYAARCVACHQASGAGLPGVFPPLAGSEWVLGAEKALLQILLHGAEGELTVKGTVYKGAMPAFGAQLADAELAAVASHIRQQWGNQAAPIAVAAVASEREASKERQTPWKGDAELKALLQ